jgi:hypothetical protein
MAQAHTGRLWDDLPYETWTSCNPTMTPDWDSDKMSVCYRVSGALKPARFHAGRWQYRVNQETDTWKNCGMKKNLILRTYKMEQQVVQNTIVVEGGEEDSHKCNICLEDVQFPMSNGCCSFKFCKDCYEQLPPEQKRICPGCRASTPFTVPTTGNVDYNGRNARQWYNLYTGTRSVVDTLHERITEYQDNLMSANTRNEELLEQIETQKCDIDLLETSLHLEEKKVKELKEQLENNRIWRANSKTLWKGKVLEKQRMYNKVIRLSIILFILLVFSVLR